MREIKFRYIFEDSLGEKHSLTQTIEDLEYSIDIPTNIKHGWRLIARSESTGLLDKQGKEIYEGDIVSKFGQDIHSHKIENRYVVRFGLYDNGESYEANISGNGWYLADEMFFRSGKREAGLWESKCEHFLDANNLECIGNIYENSYLLLTRKMNERMIGNGKASL